MPFAFAVRRALRLPGGSGVGRQVPDDRFVEAAKKRVLDRELSVGRHWLKRSNPKRVEREKLGSQDLPI